jgi:hypothetical protein
MSYSASRREGAFDRRPSEFYFLSTIMTTPPNLLSKPYGGKSDEQDFYVFSPSETAQVAYQGQRVLTISSDYTGEVGAPDYKSVVGEGLLLRPDGSVFRMVFYNSERFWVSYNKSASVVPIVTITIGTLK